ncbi:MAG: ABC transporter permease [Cytophagales bacterium]|nr:ABC transporter permease [Cytophagales bacterium]
MKHQHRIPPKSAERFLNWFCKDELLEEILGDLHEYYDELSGQPRWKISLLYWFHVLNFIRPFAIRNFTSTNTNHYTMYRNYLKISWRNLSKEKMYASIKIGGTALSIAACLLIALFIQDELSFDKHVPNGNRIYRLIWVFNNNGDIEKDVFFQAPFANAILEEFPEIEQVGRYNAGELFGAGSKEIRRAGEKQNILEKGFVYSDQSLIDLLQIPMVYGERSQALAEPNSIVLSESKAQKYFPNENPIGKTLILDNDVETPFTIGGVIKDFPTTSHLQYDFLMTMTNREFWPGEQTFWRASNYPTYLKLHQDADPVALSEKMKKITNKYLLPAQIEAGAIDAEENAKNTSYELQAINDIHLYSQDIFDELKHGDIRIVWLFGIIAGFILLIACINFINLSTAKSANRAKEVGLRKVVGSYRISLVQQFMTESVLYSSIAFVLGVFLAVLLLPYFNIIVDKTLVFPWTAWWFASVTILGSIAIGLVSGIYPSIYLSAFQPIEVLKGRLTRGSKSSYLRSTLVVFQFATSIVLIIGTIIIFKQMNFILNTKIGFEKDQVILLKGTNTLGDKIATFKDALLQLSEVKSVSVSDYLPISDTKRNGNAFWREGKAQEDKPIYGQIWRVDHAYIETMGMRIVAGRDFQSDIASDSQAVIINQKMVEEFGFENPLDKRVTNSGAVWNVIGVVENFHFESLKEDIRPLCMVIGNSPSIVAVKINTNNMREFIGTINGIWDDFLPNQPMRYTFLDEDYASMYADVTRTGNIFSSFAILAIVVACMGLLALSAFMIEQRNKEISIHKVLGASIRNILVLLTKDFLSLVLLAFVFAIPIAWYVMDQWLQDFSYKIAMEWWVFALAGCVAFLIANLTIGYQAIRAALMNPVHSLRSE